MAVLGGRSHADAAELAEDVLALLHTALGTEVTVVALCTDATLTVASVSDRHGVGLACGDELRMPAGWTSQLLAGRAPDGLDVATCVIVPLRRGDGSILGALGGLDRRRIEVSAHGLETLSLLAGVLQRQYELDAALARERAMRAELRAAVGRQRHDALHDPLTGLPNRTMLARRLSALLDVRRRRGGDTASGGKPPTQAAVLFCGLDRFKVVNDSLGHDAGDRLLVEVAQRLRALVRPADLVTRFAGDEFVLLCPAVDSEADAVALARRVIEGLSAPFEVDGVPLLVGATIGVAMTRPGDDPAALLHDADAAMCRAKFAGRGSVETFRPAHRVDVREQLHLDARLRRAVDCGELVVHYQPVLGRPDGGLVGVEALVRWQHPERGLLYPGSFLPHAEASGLIVELSTAVLRTALLQVAAWDAAFPGQPLQVGVNLPARSAVDPELPDAVSALLAETGLAPDRLILELTETALLHDVAAAAAVLGRLAARGVVLALDDFGTGFSSLAHVRTLPLRVLKIDRSFVAGCVTSTADAAVVRALVELALGLGIDTVAEGVETPEQLATVDALGCGFAQGYLLGRPGPPEDIERLLRAVSGAPVRGTPASSPSTSVGGQDAG